MNQNCSPRLVRWRHRLLPYDSDVELVSGQEIGIEDYLSRSPTENVSENTQDTEELKTPTIQFLKDFNQRKRAEISKVKSNTDKTQLSEIGALQNLVADETGKVFSKEFIKAVNSGKGQRDPNVRGKRIETLDKIAEITDITLEKLVVETNKDRILRLVRQAVKTRSQSAADRIPKIQRRPQHRTGPCHLRRKNRGPQFASEKKYFKSPMESMKGP